MGWMPGCPQDPGVYHGALAPIAVVLHRTYGAWGGDYSVGKQGIFHILLGKQDGRWAQFAPTEVVQYHCNGANYKAVGIEIEGTNDDPLTAWQSARLGDVLHWLNGAHGIPLTYLDPLSRPAASVHVNDGGFRGAIAHYSVATDDGSSQHSDLITVAEYNRAVGSAPAPGDEDDDMAKPTYISKKSDSATGIWATDGVWKRHVNPDEWAFVQFVDPSLKPLPLSDAWWDSLITAK